MASKHIGPYSTSRKVLANRQTYYSAVLGQQWGTDFDGALFKAAQQNDMVLAAFVGLSWCYPCQKLEAEVFQTFDFLEWALGKVVLLQLDYVSAFDQNSAKKKELAQQYDVSAFPSILGLQSDGTEMGRVVGYSIGSGPANWIASFEAVTGL